MKPATVRRILDRDNGQCVIAGPHCQHVAVTADHRANRGHGGSTVLDSPVNLIACCGVCNGLKEDATGAYRAGLVERGVRVGKAATNSETVARAQLIPVVYPDGFSYWLTPDFRRVRDEIPPF